LLTLRSTPRGETKEVFRMPLQKLRPDEGRDERQEAQRRQVNRTLTFGSLAIAATIGAIAVLMGIVAVNPEERAQSTAAGSAVPGGGTEFEASPTAVPVADPPSVGFMGLPPEGATQSAPRRGELVSSFGGIHPWSATRWYAAYLYADGRLIWTKSSTANTSTASDWMEQRLTPKGVHYLRRSRPDLWVMDTRWLPAGAWDDPMPRHYVPSTYTVVGWVAEQRLDADSFARLLPPRARDLLRGEHGFAGPGFEMTIEDARVLAEILDDAGFRLASGDDTSLGVVSYARGVTFGTDVLRHLETLVIEFHAVLPDGRVPSLE
jgi:hypothetical protein